VDSGEEGYVLMQRGQDADVDCSAAVFGIRVAKAIPRVAGGA
jgi:hypothetical protein